MQTWRSCFGRSSAIVNFTYLYPAIQAGRSLGKYTAINSTQQKPTMQDSTFADRSNLRVNTPTEKDLIDGAKGLAPLLKKMGPIHDEERRISDEVATRLRDIGLFRIVQSVENGGYGMRPSVLWKAAREITRVDPATGWVLSLTGLHPWLAGMFSPQAQDEVFEEGSKDALILALTGNVGRDVDAKIRGDGFEITGKWAYASGVDVADWVTVLVECKMCEGKEMLLLLVPQRNFHIDHNSWKTFGMRGTGSKDVYLDHVFVPSHRAVRWADIGCNKAAGKARNKGPMYEIPHTSLLVMSVAAAVVGAATCMLDLYRETVKVRMPAGLQTAQTEDRFSLVTLGKAASQIEMAFKVLIFDVDEMYDQAASGRGFSEEQRTRYRTDGAMISDLALVATDALSRSLGGSLLPNGPIERCFRDVHSMASHFLMQINPAAELLGRKLVDLPLPPNARI